jgi:hypothetical protein
MFGHWGYSRSRTTVAVLVSGVWNAFAKLGLPVLALALLRPVNDRTLAEARKLAPSLKGATTDREVLAVDARKAWLRLQDLAQTYSSLHEARRAVVAAMAVEVADKAGMFAKFSDTNRWRPNPRIEALWPEAPWARLAWLVSADVTPWLPTPSEQQARLERWWEESGAAQRARNNEALHAMRRG